MRNGYFQIICGVGETALKIFPPRDGGKPFNAKEVVNYLNRNGIQYDVHTLSEGFRNVMSAAEEEYQFRLNQVQTPEIDESYMFQVSEDGMMAVARFYPPSAKGSRLTAEKFLGFLESKKVRFGIRKEGLANFFLRPIYCTDIIVAKGQPPRHGNDARIEYYFEADLHAKPTLKEDGSVDFFNLNTINHCKKGEVLARLFPGDPGERGTNVFGEKINPRNTKQMMLKFGHNIAISEDKQVLTTEVDGHVSLVGDKVFVSNILEVENVDNSTGNIDYDGTVKINGNVCTNFSVKAKGNIEVSGVVEGAHLEASENIIIARGMNGMGRGVLKAEGNVISKFLENAKVSAGGYVATESILHSDVVAGTEIVVSGRRGFITGGRVCAANLIQVKTLGSSMGADTLVEVGVEPGVRERIQELQKELVEGRKEIESIHPVLLTITQKMNQGVNMKPEQLRSAKEMMQREKQLRQEQKDYEDEVERLQQLLVRSNHASVEVSGEVFGGTKICISDVSMVVKNVMSFCRFIREGGEVRMTSL